MMRPVPSRTRAGITLTEILISIMIMGVGLVSLATLFPVGLERIRAAQRSVRSVQLANSARADIGAMGLLSDKAFRYNYWFPLDPDTSKIGPYSGLRDPWLSDTRKTTADPVAIYRGLDPTGSMPLFIPGDGLPVAYDPLWWAQVASDGTTTPRNTEGRFAADVAGAIRVDQDGGPACAFGLQRITTIQFLNPDAFVRTNYDAINTAQVFATVDDPVLMTDGPVVKDTNGNPLVNSETGSPILPSLDANGSTVLDWTYTWMFTGRRLALKDPTYVGDVVIFHNRPLSLDTNGGAAGERVVEAVFGYGKTINDFVIPGTRGYSPQDRTVLLRWASSREDPQVKVGSWIADVTYERYAVRSLTRFESALDRYPGQRCHWYRISRKSDPEPDPEVAGHRRMIVTTDEKLMSRTLQEYSDPTTPSAVPLHINAALISPYVVNVLRNQTIIAK